MSTPTVPSAKRRAQAVAGGLAGLALVVVLAVVFFVVRATGDDEPAGQAQPAPSAAAPGDAAAPEPTPTQPAPTQPAQPGPVDTPPALSKEPVVKGGKGTLAELGVKPLVQGTGPAVKKGQTITVNYVLVDYKTGKPIESSWQSQPASFPIGVGAVIPGWDQGIPGQKVGSRVQLDIPAALAYGPSKGDLRFVVDILAAQ